jgi:hypothetical protein
MEPNPTKTDEFLEEIKDCKDNEYCILESIINFINESDVRLLEPALQERKAWKDIRDPDCKVDENYGLWLLEDEAATEIESSGGDFDVSDYTSIVGLGFPPSKEKNTPFLKTTVTVKAPNLKAAFVRGTEALQQVGGHEEFVSELPKCQLIPTIIKTIKTGYEDYFNP